MANLTITVEENGQVKVTEGEKKLIRTIAEFLTAKETAEFLKISPSTLIRWNKSGYLTPVRVGSRKMYRIEDLEAILAGK